jgi:hypothetical protein
MNVKQYVNMMFGDLVTEEEKSRIIIYLIANDLQFNAENLQQAFERVRGLRSGSA